LSTRITIITPTLNRREWLGEALTSVARQQWPEVEHIVVDGGSSDGTVEWLRTLPDVKLITGADRGVYDAMNKGLLHATGEVVGFLNSDDYFLDGAFEAAANAFAAHPRTEIVAGRALVVAETGEARELAEPFLGPEAARAALIGVCLPNSRFFRRSLFERVGGFDATFRLVADRDFVLRLLAADVATVPLDAVVYAYRQHAGSLTHNVGRPHALALRRELLELAMRWGKADHGPAAIPLNARILEGRSRIGILRDAAGALSMRQKLALITRHENGISWRPADAILRALVDLVATREPKRRGHGRAS
jgi:glycosyltransferase involved in cell wall biosynthesis